MTAPPSVLFEARMAFFDLSVDAPNWSAVMLHWSAAADLGPPLGPYEIQTRDFGDNWDVGVYESVAGPRYSEHLMFSSQRESTGLAVAAVERRVILVNVTAQQDAVVWAVDEYHREINGSRRTIGPATDTWYFGSTTAGIAAEGSNTAVFVRVWVDRASDDNWSTVAEVAPTLAAITEYSTQSLAGQQFFNAHEALDARRQMHTLVLAKEAPVDPDLALIYAPADFEFQQLESRVLYNELVRFFEDEFDDVLAGASAQLAAPGGQTQHLLFELRPLDGDDSNGFSEIDPLEAIQLLAVTGPAEASALGQGVVIDYPFPSLSSGGLLLRVVGTFPSAVAGVSRRYVAYPRLVDPPGIVEVAVRDLERPYPPQSRDADAHSAIEVALAGEPDSAEAVFLVRDGVLLRSDPAVTGHLGEVRLHLRSASSVGGPMAIADGLVPLDDRADTTAVSYEIHRRDEFGRWAPKALASIVVPSWPPSAPTLISARPIYGQDLGLHVEIDLSWPWGVRTPKRIRLGVRVAAAEVNVDLESPETLILSFDSDASGPPHPSKEPVRSGGLDLSAFRILQYADDQPGPDHRAEDENVVYRLVVPLGKAGDLFDGSGAPRIVSIGADGISWRSGDNRIGTATPIASTISDPRPPVLLENVGPIIWASIPNANGIARASLRPPLLNSSSLQRSAIEGVRVWRANESRIMEFVSARLGTGVEDDLDAIRGQRNMQLRWNLLARLVRSALARPGDANEFSRAFVADSTDLLPRSVIPDGNIADGDRPTTAAIEIELPGGQIGLEFVTYTAVGHNRVSSDKLLTVDGLQVVAVPNAGRPAKPDLRILSIDSAGLFQTTGTRIFLVSSTTPFDERHVSFFRDSAAELPSDITTPMGDDVLSPLQGVTPISLSEASVFVPDLDRIIEELGGVFWRLFTVQLPQQWLLQFVAVDLRGLGDGPAASVPSPRSSAVATFVPPSSTPVFHDVSKTPTGWTLTVDESLPIVSASLEQSEIYLEYRGGTISTFGPWRLSELLTTQTAGPGLALVELVGNRLLVDSAVSDGQFVVKGRDPLGRVGEARLAP